jgi:hypothetical protein
MQFDMKKQKLGNSGQGLTEYLMLVFLIGIVSLGLVQSIGKQVKGKLETVRDNIDREIVLND